MPLKIVEIEGKKYAEIDGDKPVYTKEDGSTVTYDAESMHATIGRLNAEAKGHREAKEAAETKLQTYGDLDPEKAKKALETVANLDGKTLIDAGEVDKVKAEAIKAVEDKYKPIVEERDSLKTELHGEKIGGSFSRSKYISEKIAIPADMVESRFGRNFKLDNGKVVATDNNGNMIYSKSNPGELAPFDEAMEILVEQYPHRDSILKGSGQSGSGAQPGAGGGSARTVTRAQFGEMSPSEQAKVAAAAGKGELQITD